MTVITIEYLFKFTYGAQESITLDIEKRCAEMVMAADRELPFWARLDFHTCPNCPLPLSEHDWCPLAGSLVEIVGLFDRVLSYDKVAVEVKTPERTILQTTSAQKAVSSLMGVVIATSGCPHTVFLKPMARFHLPFASREETLYRATSMYLLAQHFREKRGQEHDSSFEGLKQIYADMEEVNIAIAERLRVASESDTSVNSLIVLDVFTKIVPYIVDCSLDDLESLFTPYL